MESSDTLLLHTYLYEHPSEVVHELRGFLHKAIKDVSILGPQFAKEHRRLIASERRLGEGAFRLAILGPPGSGKNTLTNALLGEVFLPAGADAPTRVPLVISYGPEPSIRVLSREETALEEFAGETAEDVLALLHGLVTEPDSFNNGREIGEVEILHPAPILRHGIVLLHCPGIVADSMGDWTASVELLTGCDAVLFVVSSRTPPTELEMEVLREIDSFHIPVFVILNKIDELNAIEQETALDFLRKEIQAVAVSAQAVPIFAACAQRGLQAKLFGDWSLWKESGLQDVETHVTHSLLARRVLALRESIGAEILEVIYATLIQIRLTIQSLQSPLQLLRTQLNAVEVELKDIQRQQALERASLRHELGNTLKALEDDAETLRGKSFTYLERVAKERLCDAQTRTVERGVQDALAQAITSFFSEALIDLSRRFDARVSYVFSEHRGRAEALTERVLEAAARVFGMPYPSPTGHALFEMKRRPYWVLRKWVPAFPMLVPQPWVDGLLPANLRHRRLKKRIYKQVDALVSQNVENLRWAMYQNVKNAFDRFASELDERFLRVVVATRGTIEAACIVRKEYADKVADRMTSLVLGQGRLETLCEELRSWLCSQPSLGMAKQDVCSASGPEARTTDISSRGFQR